MLRVAHVPHSPYRSAAGPLVPELRRLGVDMRAYDFRTHHLSEDIDTNVIPIRRPELGEYGRAAWASLRYLALIARADLVHWYRASPGFLPRRIDYRVISKLRKPGVVEWQGSDIRNPAVELSDNPVYKELFLAQPELFAQWGTTEKSLRLQAEFVGLDFGTVVPPGMWQYVAPELRDRTYLVQRAVDISGYEPAHPDQATGKPIVAHAPSKQVIKGTGMVLQAVDQLEGEVDFDFRLIHGVSHAESTSLISGCDIFVDQMVLGDYGIAAIEAMALGKPVVCYIKPSIAAVYDPTLPIVSANPDTLADVLGELISDEPLRLSLGREGRVYAEKFHSLQARASALKAAYEAELSRS